MISFQDSALRARSMVIPLGIIAFVLLCDIFTGSKQAMMALILVVGGIALVHEWPHLNSLKTPAFAWYLLGLLYIGPATLMAMYLYGEAPLLLLWLLSIAVAADIGAYFTGRAIGTTPLWKSVSPTKTWEGALGGILAAIFVGGSLGQYVPNISAMPTGTLLLATAFLAVASIGGDLLESWLKRRARVKDTSNILPGHGGLLDRLDSHIVVTPLGYIFVHLTS